MTIQASPSDQLIFAPVGIAHLTADNTDLVRAAATGRSRIRVTTAAQLNGIPHLGTVVTMLTVFAFIDYDSYKNQRVVYEGYRKYGEDSGCGGQQRHGWSDLMYG